MKVVALVSGGKDSCHSMFLCSQEGHEIVALANLLPEESAPDELDSYMYQTVGHQLVEEYASCMGVPLFRKRIMGTCAATELSYSKTDGDEVEDLYTLLSFVKDSFPSITAVASGAIASDYQRLRVENVCSRLKLVSLAYLWHLPQRQLIRSMVESNLQAILVKVAALGLEPRQHLGRSIADLEPYLLSLSDRFGANVCGEGGEYESLTLDCPLFIKGRIVLDKFEVVMAPGASSGGIAPVGHLQPLKFHVEPKQGWEHSPRASDVREVPSNYVSQRVSPNRPSAISDECEGHAPFSVSVGMRAGRDYMQLSLTATTNVSGTWQCSEVDTIAALRSMLRVLQTTLLARGLSLEHCLYVHLYMSNLGHFAAANNVYCEHFPTLNPPSRACVQVPLPPGCPAMLDIILANSTNSTDPTITRWHPRKVLHVQSISYWAPSCIGPYSQANCYRGLVYMAGMLPLDPSSMTIVPGDVEVQTLRALSSCEAVAISLRTSLLRAALGLTVYHTAILDAAGRATLVRTVEKAMQNGLPPLAGAPIMGSSPTVHASPCVSPFPVMGAHGLLPNDSYSLRPSSFNAGRPTIEQAADGSSGLDPSSAAMAVGTDADVEDEADVLPQLRGESFFEQPSKMFARPSGLAALRREAVQRASPLASHASPAGTAGAGSSTTPAPSAASPISSSVASAHDSVQASAYTPRDSNTAHMGKPSVRRSLDNLTQPELAKAAGSAGQVSAFSSILRSGSGGDAGSDAAYNGGHSAGQHKLDPYLEPPVVSCPLYPNIVYLEVQALPRSSLVEVQPMLIDLAGLAARKAMTGIDPLRRQRAHIEAAAAIAAQPAPPAPLETIAASRPPSAASTPSVASGAHYKELDSLNDLDLLDSDDDDDFGKPVGAPVIITVATATVAEGVNAVPDEVDGNTGSQMTTGHMSRAHSLPEPGASNAVPSVVASTADLHVTSPEDLAEAIAAVIASAAVPPSPEPSVAAVASRPAAYGALCLEEALAQASLRRKPAPTAAAAFAAGAASSRARSAYGLMKTADAGSMAAAAAAAASAYDRRRSMSHAPLTGLAPSATADVRRRAAREGPPGRRLHRISAGQSNEVMVTTVCYNNQVLRSLLHLPAALFKSATTAGLEARFRVAAASILKTHGLELGDACVSARCWYKVGHVKVDHNIGIAAKAGRAESHHFPSNASSEHGGAQNGGSRVGSRVGSRAGSGGGSGASTPTCSNGQAGSAGNSSSQTESYVSQQQTAAATAGPSLHVLWVPVLDVYTASSRDCVAVLELLATA